MIPARIAHSKKKIYDLKDGNYFGFWQDYFVWIGNAFGVVIYRFETNIKCPNKRGEKVTVKMECPRAYVYEILKTKTNT